MVMMTMSVVTVDTGTSARECPSQDFHWSKLVWAPTECGSWIPLCRVMLDSWLRHTTCRGCTLSWIMEVAHLIYVCCTTVPSVGFTTSWMIVVLRFSFFIIGGEGFSSTVQWPWLRRPSMPWPLELVSNLTRDWTTRGSEGSTLPVLCPRPKWGQEAAEIRPLSPHWRGFKGLAAHPCLWGHGCPC